MRDARPICSVALACVAALTAVGCRTSAPPDEITVKRINVVDDSGKVRFVIGGELTDVVVRGERLKRSIAPTGILWHDEDGDESGGIIVAPVSMWKGAPKGSVRTITFDFTHQITDAVRLETYESEDGNVWSGGLTVFDRRPYDAGPITSSQGKERIYLGTQNGNAGLAIRDAQERERIRIGVSQDGTPAIEILDENGKVVHRYPEQ